MADAADADVAIPEQEDNVIPVQEQLNDIKLKVDSLTRNMEALTGIVEALTGSVEALNRRVNPQAAANTKPAVETFRFAVLCSISLTAAVLFSFEGFREFSELCQLIGKRGGS